MIWHLGGLAPPPLTKMEDLVEEIVGIGNSVISGIIGGEDTSNV